LTISIRSRTSRRTLPTHYQPFASDFNGDGMADIGLPDANTGIFFIKHGPSFGDQISYQWATGTNYQPFAADFNGDHLADIGL
jgi:membrane-bound lytic murein transglycosylase B